MQHERSSLRSRWFALLSPDNHDTLASNRVNYALIALILANIIAVSLSTVSELVREYHKQFLWFEVASVIIFSVEYALRFWTEPERGHSTEIDSLEQGVASDRQHRYRFLFSFDSVVDIVSILPLYLSLFFGIELRMLIALRLLRLLKLVRYFSPLVMLVQVVKSEARAFFAAVCILLLLVFVAASGIYFFEREAQPEQFSSIPEAMWWATVTLTTLGYGDVVPVTLGGKLFAAAMTVLSLGIVALPAGMLASRFSEELHLRKQNYSMLINELADDGSLNEADLSSLEEARQTLCLSKRDARALQTSYSNGSPCLYCNGSGKSNTPVGRE